MRPLTMPAGSHGSWALMAEMHRPTDSTAIAAEIRRLRQTGLTVHDIAAALHLGVAAVEQALRQEIA
jgi:hypothetical protein